MDEINHTRRAPDAAWNVEDPFAGRRSPGGVGLCPDECLQRQQCRIGILTERLDSDGIGRFDLTCPAVQTHGGGQAHGDWAPGVLCEMAGHTAILLGTPTFLGTLTTRYLRPIPVAEPLLGHARVDRREGKKLFVEAAIVSPHTGDDLATATALLIAMDAKTMEELRRL
jgi:acyl-coenzyme A thioesterase PaaI-like protein